MSQGPDVAVRDQNTAVFPPNLADVQPFPLSGESPSRTAQPPPMVYVATKLNWEYKVIVRNLLEDDPLTEKELNDLGAESWELVAPIAQNSSVTYYFKRTV